jgi:phage recombination protein Bet
MHSHHKIFEIKRTREMSTAIAIHGSYEQNNEKIQHIPQNRAQNAHIGQTIEFTQDKLELLKNTICKDATNDELELFLHACKRTGLDPFMKQIHAVKRWDPKLKRQNMTIQVGIDGYRLIAERTGTYMPAQEPTFVHDQSGRLISATSYAKKWGPDGQWHTISATAFYEEYVQTKTDKETQTTSPVAMWEKMPRSQTAKCSEALVLRKGWPADFSGVLSKEEMEQSMSDPIDVTPQHQHVTGQQRQSIAQQPPIPRISKEQAGILDDLIAEDMMFRKSVMDRLAKNGVGSLAEIPLSIYQQVYNTCFEHDQKRQLAKAQVIEAPAAPSVFDKD